MDSIKLIKSLSEHYGFDIGEALILLNIEPEPQAIKTNTNCTKETIDIKPFDGIIHECRCKAVVYNHGLYTQCENICTKEFCGSLCKSLKYGHINHRKDYPVGTYVLTNGKKEVSYNKILKRLKKKKELDKIATRIYTEDSDDAVEIKNTPEKKRGRPKHPNKQLEINNDINDADNTNNTIYSEYNQPNNEICVKRFELNGNLYLIDKSNIVYDFKTFKVLGRYIESLERLLEL